MKLRPYQIADVEATFRLWDRGHKGVLTRLATGLGKTTGSSAKMQRWLAGGCNRRCMVLVHETQLVGHWEQTIARHLGVKPEVEMAARRANHVAPIVIASRASLLPDKAGKSRLHKFDPNLDWLVIFDECDRYVHKQVSTGHIIDWFDQNPRSRRSGITGTQNRYDGVSLLDKMFPGVACDIDIRKAIDEGWSVHIQQAFVEIEGVDFDALPAAMGSRDEVISPLLLMQVAKFAKPTRDLAGDRRTIMFSPSVAVAHAVAAFLNHDGVTRCKAVDGSLPNKERERIYREHQAGAFQFLSCCSLCMRGYDDPGISCVAMFRSFSKEASAAAEQCIGRGLRVLPNTVDGLNSADERCAAIAASRKPDCLLIDLVGGAMSAKPHSVLDLLHNGLPDEVVWALKRRLTGNPERLDLALTDVRKTCKPAWCSEFSRDFQAWLETLSIDYSTWPALPPWKRPGTKSRWMYERLAMIYGPEALHKFLPARHPIWDLRPPPCFQPGGARYQGIWVARSTLFSKGT